MESTNIQDMSEEIQGYITDAIFVLGRLLAEVNPRKGSEAEGDISYVIAFNETLIKEYDKVKYALREIEG